MRRTAGSSNCNGVDVAEEGTAVAGLGSDHGCSRAVSKSSTGSIVTGWAVVMVAHGLTAAGLVKIGYDGGELDAQLLWSGLLNCSKGEAWARRWKHWL